MAIVHEKVEGEHIMLLGVQPLTLLVLVLV
eukprot:SAG31_NODE_36596_length_312_cov_0.596244_1_plen_29_part_10